MKRKTRIALLAVSISATVAGAVIWTLPLGSSPTRAPEAAAAACRQGQEGGYALTGNSINEALLRPLTLCPLALGEPILADAPTQRMSYLSGSGERAVVTEFGSGSDRIALVTPEGLVPVPGLGPQIGHSAALAPDGRITYTEKLPAETGEVTFAVRMFDPATRARTTVMHLRVPPSGVAWGPNGRLALVADAGATSAQILMLDRPNAAPRRRTPLPGAVGVRWLPSGALLVTVVGASAGAEPRAVVVDAATGKLRVEVDLAWRPVGLTEDGSLVAVRSSTAEIARLPGPAYDSPEVYGVLPSGENVWQVVL